MKRSVRIFLILATFIIASSVAADVWEIDYTYYSDGTFTTVVGWETKYCDGSTDGTPASNWRTRDRILCNTGDPDGHACQQLIGGTWTLINCP
jgi:hypothetical protein